MKILVQALFLLGLALFALGQRLHAETSLYGTQPVTPDGGNTWRTRSSSATSGAVLLSTRAAVATQGTSGAVIGMYRYRQIVNLSTNSVLSITPSLDWPAPTNLPAPLTSRSATWIRSAAS